MQSDFTLAEDYNLRKGGVEINDVLRAMPFCITLRQPADKGCRTPSQKIG
jgi:hypothetical protein